LATDREKKQEAAQEEKEKEQETVPELVASIASVLVIGVFIITFCMQAFEIPTPSMVKTLLIGDHVFVDRICLAPKNSWLDKVIPYRDPKRGDIIVFKFPQDPERDFIKRVIGLPGDELAMRQKKVYINGTPLDAALRARASRLGRASARWGSWSAVVAA